MVTEASQHIIMTDEDGEPLSPDKNKKKLSALEYVTHIRSVLDGIDSFPVNSEGKKKILIFVHGGLNSLGTGVKRATAQYEEILNAGYYPIFVNWRAGLISSYLSHLFHIRQGRTQRLWGFLTSPFYLIADLAQVTGRAFIVWYNQLTTNLKTTLFELPDEKNAHSLFKELERRYKAAPGPGKEIAISLGEDTRSTGSKIVRPIVFVILLPTKLISVPFIDAFGRSAWEIMLRRTKTLFRSPNEFDIRDVRNDPQKVKATLDSLPTGALSTFLEALTKKINPNPGQDPFTSEYEITLVGHSMGVFVLNHVIRDYSRLPYKKIVYMAAACSIRDFVESVVPYLKNSNGNSTFHNLCLHPLAEAREISSIDLAPRGSLLEWIDNFFSTPQTTPDRTLGKWENILQSTQMIPESIRGQVTIKGFAVGLGKAGGRSNPERHGGFDVREVVSNPDFINA